MRLLYNVHGFDLICFSHLRWDFVYQRPQHLLSRHVTKGRVFYFEEPVWDATSAWLEFSLRPCGVGVAVPHLSISAKADSSEFRRRMLEDFFFEHGVNRYCLWYYSPMDISWTGDLEPLAVIYDCMDELSAFKNAPPELTQREGELLKRADVVFTGGYSLYEKKKDLHPNVYPFPSSIDVPHFARSRGKLPDPSDQAAIPDRRVGFAGVIDERMDLQLLASVADMRPDWQFVMLGPVVKIDAADLPRRDNIHYLGMKAYDELPAYFANWDAAMLPFALNESTKYISPTKIPEYLAAGLPVVSTSIRDVVRPYGTLGLVHIADGASEFGAELQHAMEEDRTKRVCEVDALLSQNSWSRTWRRMFELIEDAVAGYGGVRAPQGSVISAQRALTARVL